MLLVGQPQLREKLQRKRMEQFVQRVTVSCHLDGLGRNQVEGYIRHRLTVAGAQHLDLFDPDAIEAIYRHSKGIPRLINTLCDSALVYGYADDVKIIGRDLIDAVAHARSLGVHEDTPGSFPDEEDKAGAASDSAGGPVGELLGKIRALEERLFSQENEIRNLTRDLQARNGNRDDLEKIFTKMFREMKKSYDSRAKLEARIERLQERLEEKESSSSQPSLLPEPPHNEK
jgi:general secretion pathway protein A